MNSRFVTLVLPAVLVGALACAPGADRQRDRLLASPSVHRLDGLWTLTLTARQPAGASDGPETREVSGIIAFTTDHHGATTAGGIDGITHQGTYDLDFSPLGWTTRDAATPALVVARLLPTELQAKGSLPQAALATPTSVRALDSLAVSIGPGTSRYTVQLRGTLDGDRASGTWSATAFSGGGGSGSFVMSRRLAAH